MNDEPVKTAKEVKIGDRIGIKKNTALFEYEVVDLLEKRVGAKLVPDYLRDITRQEEKDRYQEYLNAQKEYRANGLGRPTTKERRALKKLWKKGL
ncbi:MAG: RNA-binding S4 domain-containing protein [Crocinitomicaceae bacterium]|nr:RNA-binding S4 domain-containing protein [Crocinitomicaceae bacterium]